jgi:glutamyl-tRNA synthetase
MSVVVRFAPSPTGHLHVGSLRAALFNFYFAKKHNGLFTIRIEDTDGERNQAKYTKSIIDSFAWCGIRSDREILYQSERKDIYKKYIAKLLESGAIYSAEETDSNGALSKVIKCRIPRERKKIEFVDKIRGVITFETKEFDDFIIVRSDGTPLYNLVSVIDDMETGITHVIRGEEHLSNTPKQILLYEALGHTPPIFAHLPLILGQNRKKLSKRDAVTAVIDYKKEGFLPEALCSYLLRLGWAHGDQEIFTYEEIIAYFELDKVHHAPAIFDQRKLLSVNHYFIAHKNQEELLSLLKKDFFSESLEVSDKTLLFLITLYKDRAKTLLELSENVLDIVNIDDKKVPEIITIEEKKTYQNLLSHILEDLEAGIPLTKIFKENPAYKDYDKATLYKALRLGLIRKLESPSIIKIGEALGQEECKKRIRESIEKL